MFKTIANILIFFVCITSAFCQPFYQQVDSLLNAKNEHPFNGVIVLAKESSSLIIARGYKDLEKKKNIQDNSQFVIGSISKQITAVMVLQEYEKGHFQLNDPISKYLHNIHQGWADTVTIDHLLTHMHGIVALNQPTAFKPGTQFNYEYSDMGYRLLSQIIEKTSGKSFVQLSQELFDSCRMVNTFHPDDKRYINLVKGYTEQENGKIVFEKNSFQNAVAAGGFISTAKDLLFWNEYLHQGKLLKPETYILMTTKKPGAIRNHRIFGETFYGYGITIDDRDGTVRLGQTGFAPGFVSMNFYFPATQTSIIVLENIAYDTFYDLNKTFFYHRAILDIIRKK